MDKVQKHDSFNTNTPSSESYGNYKSDVLSMCHLQQADCFVNECK